MKRNITIIIGTIIGLTFLVIGSGFVSINLPSVRIDLAHKLLADNNPQQTVYLSASAGVSTGGTSPICWQSSATTCSTNINFAGSNPSVHQVTITANDITAHTCSNYFTAYFRGSIDGSTFFDLPQYVVSALWNGGSSGSVSRTYTAFGSYPTVQVSYVPAGSSGAQNDTTNCRYAALYTGTIIGGTLLELGSIVKDSSLLSLQEQGNDTAAATSTDLITAPGKLGIEVYTMSVCNTTAAQTVTLFSTNSGNFFKFPNMIAGQCVVLGGGKAPLFSTAFKSDTVLSMSLANATNVSTFFTFRFI